MDSMFNVVREYIYWLSDRLLNFTQLYYLSNTRTTRSFIPVIEIRDLGEPVYRWTPPKKLLNPYFYDWFMNFVLNNFNYVSKK
ncbi:hypothetical protein Phum_PHUM489320 [Pediculus humanus corporis]|uniref:Uncharacterized protein n=1 Tax=Pediculus humanus subsp. corporis TaxID=121224 RepID=E0VWN7_PEDHC|nr:uncharacterized protein Phum_PHUM489320 [Pediculus humanus corporis]EEB17793.1 hypothetical protein Phum_PHUM489320 [Pediculus humanus corporis]